MGAKEPLTLRLYQGRGLEIRVVASNGKSRTSAFWIWLKRGCVWKGSSLIGCPSSLSSPLSLLCPLPLVQHGQPVPHPKRFCLFLSFRWPYSWGVYYSFRPSCSYCGCWWYGGLPVQLLHEFFLPARSLFDGTDGDLDRRLNAVRNDSRWRMCRVGCSLGEGCPTWVS